MRKNKTLNGMKEGNNYAKVMIKMITGLLQVFRKNITGFAMKLQVLSDTPLLGHNSYFGSRHMIHF